MYDRARTMALRLGERLLREAATQEFDVRGLGVRRGVRWHFAHLRRQQMTNVIEKRCGLKFMQR